MAHLGLSFVLPYLGWYLLGCAALAGTTWITITVPHLSKQVINSLVENDAPSGRSELVPLALTIALLGMTLMLVRALSRMFFFWPGRKIEADLKNHYFVRLMSFPLTFYQNHSNGDLISRMANDVAQIRVFFAFGSMQILNFCFLVSLAVYKMWSVNPSLTLAALAPLGLLLVVTRMTSPWLHRYAREQTATLGDLTKTVTEALANVHVIQSNNAEKAFVTKIAEKSQQSFLANVRLSGVRTLIFPLSSLFAAFSYLIVLHVGGYEVIHHNLSIGDILAFNIYIGLLSFPLTALGYVLGLWQRAKVAAIRLRELDLESLETDDPAASSEVITTTSVIDIRNLSFTYRGSEHRGKALDGVSFNLEPGKMVGIVGPVGSGKSTLFQLITRLYDPPPGTIFYRGRDILTMKPQALRSHIAYATQTPYLFSDTIAGNLALGLKQPPSLTSMEQGTRKSQVLGEIESFSEQWSTPIGEKGIRLSGGQKQRLALARLFLRSPEVFLLDDITASVDFATEKSILEEVRRLNVSLLIVSHRKYMLKMCDELLLLKDGKVTDRGTPDQIKNRHPELFH